MWTEIHDPEHEFSPYTWCFLPGPTYEAFVTFEKVFGEYPDWGWCQDCRDDHAISSGIWVTEHDKTLPEVFRSLCEVEREYISSCNYLKFEEDVPFGPQWFVSPHSYVRIKRQTLGEWIDAHYGEYWIA